jgi:hypothetical protein
MRHERQAQLDAFHNNEPIRVTGNKEKEKLVGTAQMLLVIYLYAFPDASTDEIATFIWNQSGELYDRQTIANRMRELQMTKKTGALHP